jgi:exo-beta-1,3-glucanase (GH17 family)
VGIWNITSDEEIATAIRLAREYPGLVVAVIVGNEGLLFGRYDTAMLETAIQRVRAALPKVAISTSEPIGEYGDRDLLRMTDFHAPNIHPWFAGEERRKNVRAAVDYVKERVKALQSVSDKPILLHETGLPSGPEPHVTPDHQAEFWRLLFAELPNTRRCNVAFFEAFDAGEWKNTTNPSDVPVETHWGAFTNDRQPKAVVKVLPKGPAKSRG